MKQNTAQRTAAITAVAPHAGAWIETGDSPSYVIRSEVAPHAGAWIETTI